MEIRLLITRTLWWWFPCNPLSWRLYHQGVRSGVGSANNSLHSVYQVGVIHDPKLANWTSKIILVDVPSTKFVGTVMLYIGLAVSRVLIFGRKTQKTRGFVWASASVVGTEGSVNPRILMPLCLFFICLCFFFCFYFLCLIFFISVFFPFFDSLSRLLRLLSLFSLSIFVFFKWCSLVKHSNKERKREEKQS